MKYYTRQEDFYPNGNLSRRYYFKVEPTIVFANPDAEEIVEDADFDPETMRVVNDYEWQAAIVP